VAIARGNWLSKSFDDSPAVFFEFEAEVLDPRVLRDKLNQLLVDQNTEQLQRALRLLKALLKS
jgi:hypothetical protein